MENWPTYQPNSHNFLITPCATSLQTATEQNPIYNLSSCKPGELLAWITDKGGSMVDKAENHLGIMLADFDSPTEVRRPKSLIHRVCTSAGHSSPCFGAFGNRLCGTLLTVLSFL